MTLLTSRAVDALKPKDQPYKMAIDRGLQLRVAPDGVKTLLVRYTVQGTSAVRQYRLPQEYGNGAGQIKLADARAEAQRIRALARAGVDWPAEEEARLQAEAQARETQASTDGQTFAEALREYVEEKRRAKDGLPLKARTKSEYTKMVEPGKIANNGKKFADGELMALADKPLSTISAKDIKDTYTKLLARSKRRADYAMQVLRAVLRWQGIKIEDNPLSQETAGRNRIVLAPPRGDPKPIPAEKLGAWWLAACASPRRVAANYYRFQLLTGCRGVEILGEKKYDYEPIRVRDVNLETGRILLIDTKNRSNHLLLLSREALAIAKEACEGREPEEPLFPITDTRKTLAWINKQAGTTVQGHDMRATFTTIAEELVSGGVLKRMINHATNGDVTLGHYVGKGEAQLRAGWQTVADFIGNAAAEETARRATPDAMPASDVGEHVAAVDSETAEEMA
ncbi:MAG: integrase arm-type DNA-binding domain-containing protein [Castellaniella sp.]|uniref:tyrosine-type recombinase/integrase n=2 Tax=Castellaniella sp. TaxID=1955812 RepID=UPI003C76158B